MKVTFIHHSSFLIEMDSMYLLFDYTEGKLPQLQGKKPLLVLSSHRHGDHFDHRIFDIKKTHSNTRYLLSDDIWQKRVPEILQKETDFIGANQEMVFNKEDGLQVEYKIETFKSTDEGVAFLISCDGIQIYHAGDLNHWFWKGEPDSWNQAMSANYQSEIARIPKRPIFAAFLPVDPRLEEYFYLGAHEFMAQAEVNAVFPMHCWGDFTVIDRWKKLPASEAYRDKIIEISGDGDEFEL